MIGLAGAGALVCAASVIGDSRNPPGASPAARPSAGKVSDTGHDVAPPACAQPHPLITEVLYAVPSAGEADANKDGKREVSGDEFVELVNPHERSIDLRGYTITDGSPNVKSQVRFTFPSILVPPHGVVVVFNGHDSKIPGPVGDSRHAPSAVNDRFGKAAVFSMHTRSVRISFSNAGDAVCLRAPDGKCLQRIRWGKADEKAGGPGFVIDEIAPVTSKGSVQRDGIGKDASWKAHAEIDSTPFSPGVFACGATVAGATGSPPAPATTPPAPTNADPVPANQPDDGQHPRRSRKPSGAPKF
jgi:hypothetical protein